jgi:hypothetical protein
LGTNDVVWGGRPDQPHKDTIIEGVTALKAAATDVVLMDLQYAPMVLASSYYPTIEAIIADVAKQERVGLFSRFALMRNSIDGGVAQGALVSWDGIHTTVDVMIALAELLRELSQIAPVDRLSRRVQRGYPKCAKHQA